MARTNRTGFHEDDSSDDGLAHDLQNLGSDTTDEWSDDSQKSYEVEEILAERRENGNSLYLIKWTGYPEHKYVVPVKARYPRLIK